MKLPGLIKLLKKPIINAVTSVEAPCISIDAFNQMKILLRATILQRQIQIKIKLIRVSKTFVQIYNNMQAG